MGAQRWRNLTRIGIREKARKKGEDHIKGLDVIQSQVDIYI